MADTRFFTRHGPFSLAAIAEATGAKLERGDASQMIKDLAPLESADASQISFLDNVKYISAFEQSAPGACFIREKFVERAPKETALLVTEEPYTAFAKAAWLFYPAQFEPFISPQAHIGKNTQIGARCRIEAGAWIGDG